MAGGEVKGEGDFGVGEDVPAEAVDLAVGDLGDAQAFPGEAGGLPELAATAIVIQTPAQ